MSVNVEALVKAIAAPTAAPAPLYTVQPANIPGDLPADGCVVIRHLPGGARVDPRFPHTRATIQVDAYHAAKHAAFDLCADVLDALVGAWRGGVVTSHGRITRIPVDGIGAPSPIRFDDDPDGFTRYTALAQIDCAR